MKTKNICISILCIAVLSACKKDLRESPVSQHIESASKNGLQSDAELPTYAANEILVKFKKNQSEQNKNAAFASVGGTVSKKILTRAMEHFGDNEGFFVIHTALDVSDAIKKIKTFPTIEYAEPNYIYKHTAVSNDPEYINGSLWGMYGSQSIPANQYGTHATQAWAAGHVGKGEVYVGVIDEGAEYDHEDLVVNLKNPVEFNGAAGVDDDGNGYIDDTHGWDFYNNDKSTYDHATILLPTPHPQDGHGTHVCGTIGAKGGNAIGVAGVCWNVRMINAKFIGPIGGYTSDAILAIDYITDLKTRNGYNIVATNNSWGGGGFSQLLYDAINRANAADILFIAAAGNSGTNNDITPFYPASYDLANIISVAAIDNTGAMAFFSNYGALSVDLAAPGVGIKSSYPTLGAVGSTYISMDGTSMAAPHVTGAAALYASTHPGVTAIQIKNQIINQARNTPSLAGKVLTAARLDVRNF